VDPMLHPRTGYLLYLIALSIAYVGLTSSGHIISNGEPYKPCPGGQYPSPKSDDPDR
jgi:hypothetical protein